MLKLELDSTIDKECRESLAKEGLRRVKNTSPQYEDEDLNKLLNDLGIEDDGGKKKKKKKSTGAVKQTGTKKNKSKRSSGTTRKEVDIELPEVEECALEPVPQKEIITSRVSMYDMHFRVMRWREADVDDIRAFKDTIGGVRKQMYLKLDDKEINLQRAFHDLRGVEIVASRDDFSRYFFKTERGLSAFATLDYGRVHYKGLVELGIEKRETGSDLIFHLYFNADQIMKPEDFYKIADPIYREMDDDDLDLDLEVGASRVGEWVNPTKGYGISRSEREQRYCITYFDEDKVLCIIPLW